MAEYKVPQDVEADDKLLGPFSFRQFIYLIIVALAIAMGWGLSRLFIPLAIIPLPIVIFFGALALPLRKDQPMEVYLAAIVSFYLKPRRRLWKPDGLTELIEVTAPKVVEVQRMKDLSQTEAEQRLSYLANIADSRGWSVRGVSQPNTAMSTDVYYEAQRTEDVLDSNNSVSQSIDYMIEKNDTKHRQEMLARMHQPASITPAQPLVNPYNNLATPTISQAPVAPPVATPVTQPDPQVQFNPYPTSIHQFVVQPISEQTVPAQPPQPVQPPAPVTTSENVVSPDIINLANQHDLSIETIAREAKRLHDKQDTSDEVVISLH